MSTLAFASNLVDKANQAVATVRERVKPLVIWLSRKLRLTFNPRPERKLARLTALLLLPYVPSLALAAPVGGQVVSGRATITQPNTSTVQINQTTTKAVLDWQKFSIARGESVIFNQPSASSVALNRVLGGDPSQIFGSLKANGSVFLVNPAGVLFAPGASVNVGGLVGSTLSISNADFNAGNYRFANAGKAGDVLNQGTINAANGYVGLIGPRVGNDGQIIANGGSVGFGAGDKVVLSFGSTGLLNIKVDAAAVAASIDNKGVVQADGGQVQFVARSADALLNTVVNNSGIVRANALVARDGKILLDGGPRGVVSVTGSLQAKGEQAGTKGGEIKVLGDKVGLFDNASIDASGQQGGGTVLVGGNYQGKGVEANASFSYIGDKASIKADAVQEGKGGKVIVWANEQTTFAGTISAKGGAQGGDGGFVETSGKEILQAVGNVDASAAPGKGGKGGVWLLDPRNITIKNVGSSGINDDNSPFTATADDAVLSSSALGTALDKNTTITVLTGNTGTQAGNITVDATVTAKGAGTLNLNAEGSIIFTASGKIASNGKDLNVNLNAGTDSSGNSPGTNASTITMANGAAITTSDGAVSATAQGNVTLAGINTGSGDLTVKANGGTIAQASALTVGGAATFDAGMGAVNLGTHANALTKLGDVTSKGGDFSLSNTGSGSDLVTVAGSTIEASGHNVTISAGANKFGFASSGGNTTIKAKTLTLIADEGFTLGGGTYNVADTITVAPFTIDRQVRLNAAENGTSLSLHADEITALRNSGTPNIVLGASNGTGTVSLQGAVDLTGQNVTLNGGTITNSNDHTITASKLNLNSNSGAIGEANHPVKVVVTSVGATTNNSNAYLDSGSGYDVLASDVGTGLLKLQASGAISQTAGSIKAGTLAVSNTSGNTTLNQTNQITNLDTIAASDKTFTLTNGTTLGQSGSTIITAGTLVYTNTAAATNLGNANAITNLGAIDSTGGAFTLKNSASNLTLTGKITATGQAVSLDTGTKALDFGNNTVAASSLSATSHSVAIGTTASLANGGTITLKPDAGSAQISLGGSATYNINADAISGLKNSGATAITIGDSSSSGALTIGTAVDLSGTALTLNAGSFNNNATAGNSLKAGSLTLNSTGGNIGAQTAGSAIALEATTVNLGSNGGNVFVTSSTGNSTFNTTTGAGSATITASAALKLGTSSVGGTFNVNAGDGVTQTGAIGADTLNVTLSGSGKTLSQSGVALTVTGATTITGGDNTIALDNTGNKFSGAVNASNSGGTHTITLKGTGNLKLGGITSVNEAVTVVADSITQTGSGINAPGGSFTANNGAITLELDTNNFNGAAVNLAATGDISIKTSQIIKLGNVTAGNDLTVNAGSNNGLQSTETAIGLPANTTTFTVAKNSSFVSNGKKVELLTGKFDGVVSVNAGTTGDVKLFADNSSALTLGNISGNDLKIEAGSITQDSGAITATTASSFNAHNGALDLSKTANQFGGTLGLFSDGTTKASSTGSIKLSTSNVKGNLEVTSGTGITQDGGVFEVGGTSNFVGGTGAVILDKTSNKFTGAVSASSMKGSGSSIELVTDDALILGKIDAGANFVASAKGISQTAAATVSGTSSITVTDSSKNLNLNHVDNDFAGAITLTGPVTNLTLFNKHSGASLPALPTVSTDVTLNFAKSAIELPELSVGGNLSVTAGGVNGDISQKSGTKVLVTGQSTFETAGNQIKLDSADNKLGTQVNLSGLKAQVVDSGALTLGGVNLTGGSSSFKGVGISQKATTTITLGGAATFDAGNGDLLLSNNGNRFDGALGLSSVKDANLKADTGSIALTNSDTSGNLTINAVAGGVTLGGGTVGGALAVTASGDIGQSGAALVVKETTDLTLTTRHDVKLGDFANDFTKAITIHGDNLVNDVALKNSHSGADGLTTFPIGLNSLTLNYANSGVTLSGTTLTGDLTIDANGPIGQSAAIGVGGSTNLNAHGNAIKLEQANQLTGAVTVNTTGSGNDVTLVNSQLIKLDGTSSVAGALKLTASGGVNQTGGTLTADSTEVVLTTAGHVSLNQSGNDLGAVVKVSGTDENSDIALNNKRSGGVALTLPGTVHDLTITQNNSSADLTSSTIKGNLSVTAAGISQASGPLVVTGTTTLAASGKSISLTHADNVFTDALGITSAASASVSTKGALAVNGATITAGDLTINAKGDVSQGAAIDVSGKTIVSAGDAGAIKLGSFANSFADSVKVSNATGADLWASGNLTLEGATINGALSAKLGGNLAQNGALTASGTTITLSGTGQNVDLSSSNALGNVAISGSSVNDISLKNTSGSLSLPASVDDLTLEYSGNIALDTLSANSLTINNVAALSQVGSKTVKVTNATNIVKSGSIDLSNTDNNFAGSVTLNSTGAASLKTAGDLNLAASTVGTGLTLSAGGKIDATNQAIKLTSGTTTLTAGSGKAITLNHASNALGSGLNLTGGSATVASTGALELQGVALGSGAFDLTVGGNLTQTGTVVSGTTNLVASGKDIALDNPLNQITGTVTLGAATATLKNSKALTVGDSTTTGKLDLTSTDAITLAGTINSGGVLSTDSGKTTTLSGAIAANTLTIKSGGAVNQSAGTLTIGSGGTSVTLTAGGNVTLDKANDLGGTVAISGSTADDDIKLVNSHSGGVALSLPTTQFNDLNISQSASAIALAGLDLKGDLTLTIGNQNISQSSGQVKVMGATKLTAGNGTITLADTGNRFDTSLEIVSASAATIGSSSASTDLIGVNITNGDFGLTSNGGDIKQSSGVVKVSGNTTLVASGKDITLGNAANELNGTVKLSAATVTLKDSKALTVGDSTTTGKLDLTSTDAITLAGTIKSGGALSATSGKATTLGGDIMADALTIKSGGAVSQSAGTLTIGNTGTSITLTAGGSVTLDKDNDLGAALAISGSGTNDDIKLVNQHSGGVALTLPNTQFKNLDITHAASAITLPSVNLGGALTLTTTDQHINQSSGQVKVTGATKLTAGTGTITLADTGNRFDTSLEIVSASAATIGSSSTSTDLIGVNITNGDFGLTTNGGDVKQSAGVVKVSGNTTVDASGKDIELNNAANELNGTVKLAAASATLKNSKALTLGESTVAGTLDLTSSAATTLDGVIKAGGLLLQSGGTVKQMAGTLTVGNGNTSVTLSAAGDVLLDRTGNDLGASVTVAGTSVQNLGLTNTHSSSGTLVLPDSVGHMTLDYSKGLALESVKVNGNLNVKTGGALSQTDGNAQLQVSGTSTLVAADGINLSNQTNVFSDTVTFTSGNGGAVLLGTSGKLKLGASTADGNLTVTTGGAFEQLGDVMVKGNLDIKTAAGVNNTITQAGNAGFKVGGTTALEAGGNITLGTATNEFTGEVSITRGKAVTLAAKNDLILGAISNIDSLNLFLNGNLKQDENDANKALIIDGLVTIAEANPAGNISLSNPGNLLTGGIMVKDPVHDFKLTNNADNAGSITLPTVGGNLTLNFGKADVLLNGSEVSGNLDITAGKTVSQTGALKVSGTSTFAAGTGINLNVGTNSFGKSVSLNSGTGDVKLSTSSSLALTGVKVGNGGLQLTAAGAVSQSGPITQSGGAVTINGSSILLNGSNSVGGVLGFNGGSVEFTNSGAVVLGASSIGSNLKISAGGDISQNAPLSVSGEAAFFSNGSAVDVKLGELANNFSGTVTIGAVSGGALRDVELRNTANVPSKLELPGTLRNLKLTYDNSGITLPVSNLTNNLEAKAGGDITQTGAVLVPGTAKFDAGSHMIKLDNPANDFGMGVTLANTGKNDVAVSDANSLTLAASRLGSGALTLLAKGEIKQSGALVQEAGAGKVGITAQGGAITLSDAGNDFTGAVGLNNSGKFDVTLNDVNALILGDSKLGSGKLAVTAHGALSQTGPIVQEAGATGASFTVGANTIKLDHAGNDFVGPVDLSNSGKNDVTVVDANTLQLGKVNVGSGLLSVSGKDGISQSGAIIQEAGATGISLATETGTLMLNDANNQITGGIAISNTGNKDIVIDNKGSVLLSKVTLGSGGLQVIAGGDISQNDALVQAANGGVVRFETGSGKITIDNAGNDFTGEVSLKSNSGAIALNDKNDLLLGASQLGSGTVAISSHGNLNQNGALVQGANGGTVAINANKGNISLTATANDFTGRVALTGAESKINDVNALNLGQLNTGNLSVTSHGALNLGQGKVDGKLAADSGNSNITQSAALLVTGTSDLNAGTGNIRLVEPANDLGGKVTVKAASAEIISRALAIAGSLEADLTTKSNELSFGNLVVKGKLDSTASAAVTQTDVVKVGGQASIKAGGNNVTLDQANEFASIALDAANVTLNNAKALDLAASNVTGSLSITSAGAVGQSGALVITGPASINAGTNAIKLDGAGNDFKDSVSLSNSGSGNAVAISSTTALKLGAVSTDGNLTVAAAGLSQDAAGVKVGGATSIDGGAASITLASASNDFTGALSLQNSGASTVSVTDANALVLGAANVGSGALTVKAGGAISQSGAIKTAGESSFDAGSNAITLTAANQFGGAVKLAGGVTQISGTDLSLNGQVTELTANASGKLTQTASLKVSGNSNLKAGADIDLSRSDNDLGGVVTLEAANVSLQSTNNLSVVVKANANASVVAGKDLSLAGSADKLTTVSGGATQFGVANINASADIKTGGALTLTANGELNVPQLTVFVPLTQDVGTLASPFILNKSTNVTVLSIHNGFFKTPIGSNTFFDARTLPLSSCVRVNGSLCVNGAGVYNGALEAVQSSAVSGLSSKLVKEDVLTRKLKYGLAGDLQQAKAFPHKVADQPVNTPPQGDITQRAPLKP